MKIRLSNPHLDAIERFACFLKKIEEDRKNRVMNIDLAEKRKNKKRGT